MASEYGVGEALSTSSDPNTREEVAVVEASSAHPRGNMLGSSQHSLTPSSAQGQTGVRHLGVCVCGCVWLHERAAEGCLLAASTLNRCACD